MAVLILTWTFFVLSLAYILLLVGVAIGHFRQARKWRLTLGGRIKQPSPSPMYVSVVIAARNEEDFIESCLSSVLGQVDVHPSIIWDVIVVDDASTDGTVERIRSFGQQVQFIHLTEGTGKRAALEVGIKMSHGEIILLTDADSIVSKTWMKTMLSNFGKETGFVAGPVQFGSGKSLFDRMIELEWTGLMGISAGAIGLGLPINCSGANIAYRREAYLEIMGHDSMEGLSSGDDEILMQHIASRTNWNVSFAMSDGAMVTTKAPKSRSEFLSQRIRWASKGGFYFRKWHVLMNVLIWLFFFSLPLGVLMALWIPALWKPVGAVLALKASAELAVLIQSTRFYQKPSLLIYYLPAFPFQVGYVIWAGAAGLVGNFEWKSRRLKR